MTSTSCFRLMLPAAVVACMVGGRAQSAEVGADAREIHERLLTLDTHLDTPALLARPDWDIMQRHDYDVDMSQVDYPRMVQGGLDGGFWVVFTPQGPRTAQAMQAARDAALLTTLRIREMIANQPEHFGLALRADDAARIAASGRKIVFLSMENGYPLGQDASLLDTFHALGVRMFGPVHFRNNDLGDSSTDATVEWQGLSPLGKQLIDAANRLGIVLDASHASDRALDQMVELSRTPVLLSHSGCKAVFEHPRNVDDERLRKLAAAGGVIQMNTLGDYLIPIARNAERDQAVAALNAAYGPIANLSAEKRAALAQARRAIAAKYPLQRASFDDFMKHVLHALRIVGPRHVGIGADWDGGGGVIGMNDVAALPKITESLLAAGYSEADIAAIWSGNVLRVLRRAEEHAARANR